MGMVERRKSEQCRKIRDEYGLFKEQKNLWLIRGDKR